MVSAGPRTLWSSEDSRACLLDLNSSPRGSGSMPGSVWALRLWGPSRQSQPLGHPRVLSVSPKSVSLPQKESCTDSEWPYLQTRDAGSPRTRPTRQHLYSLSEPQPAPPPPGKSWGTEPWDPSALMAGKEAFFLQAAARHAALQVTGECLRQTSQGQRQVGPRRGVLLAGMGAVPGGGASSPVTGKRGGLIKLILPILIKQ